MVSKAEEAAAERAAAAAEEGAGDAPPPPYAEAGPSETAPAPAADGKRIERPSAAAIEKDLESAAATSSSQKRTGGPSADTITKDLEAAAISTGPKDESRPAWPETPADHPLTKFYDSFEELVKEAGYNEVYGINLSKSAPFHTKLILQKFLRANSNDLTKAKEQLLETLKWRNEFKPAEAAAASYEKSRFDGLGYILVLEDVPDSANKKDVVTFNIYGAVKDNQKTFGDLEGFLRWRVGLMERSVQHLDLKNAKKPIPNFGEGPDPYQGYQIHDYLRVSFLRMDPHIKAASKKTIDTLQRYYPETLSRKFFVNVPVVMGWLYAAMKLLVAKETMKKFTVLSYGNQLGPELGKGAPKEYGGEQGELKDIGEGMKLEDGKAKE